MTNDVVQYMNSLTEEGTSAWWNVDAGTMFVYMLIIAFVAAVAHYVFGVIYFRKEFGVWLKPDLNYFRNLFKLNKIISKAFMGIPVPRRSIFRLDRAQALIPYDVWMDAFRYAEIEMIGHGWDDSAYIKDLSDCEDHCFAFRTFVVEFIRDNHPGLKGGVPIVTFAYVRDKDNVKHAIIKYRDDYGISRFREGFANHPDEIELSPAEFLSNFFEV